MTVDVPTLAPLLVVNVNVLVDVAGFGVKAADTPFGNPETENVTLLLKPFTGTTVMVVVCWLPRAMLILVGEAER